MFDRYASLGYNCEGAFQIRRALGRDDSNFFSWNITTFDALDSLLANRFEGIMNVENFRHHTMDLVRDLAGDYMFHSLFPHEENINYSDYPEIVQEHQEKAAYLVEKFIAAAQSDDIRTCYFYKTDEADARDRSVRVRDLLLDLSEGRQNFQLVTIQTADRQESSWDEPMVFNRYAKRFAAIDDAHDGHVSSWDRIFAEFPHREGLRLAGY